MNMRSYLQSPTMDSSTNKCWQQFRDSSEQLPGSPPIARSPQSPQSIENVPLIRTTSPLSYPPVFFASDTLGIQPQHFITPQPNQVFMPAYSRPAERATMNTNRYGENDQSKHNRMGEENFGGFESAQNSPLKHPRIPPVSTSPIGSPIESRREFSLLNSQQQNSMLGHHLGYSFGGHAQPAKVLIDPHTGQQYIMAAGPSTLQYVPAAIPTMGMFCNNPSQINQYSQSSQPIFQPITFQQPGYIFTPLSMKSNTSAFDEQSDYYEHSRVQYTKSQSESEKCDEIAVGRNQNVYRVEVPPSTAPSVCDEMQPFSNFQRHHQTRVSTESYNSAGTGSDRFCNGSRERVNDQKPQHWPHFNKPLDLNEYSKNGGESTSSGFVSAGSDESARQEQLALVKRRDLTGNQLNQSPIFVRKQILAEKQSNESCRPEEGAPQAQKASTPIRLMRSIRMDIDLNRPLSPEENAVRVTPSKVSAPPTAFTIPFNDEKFNSSPNTKLKPVLSSGRRVFNRNITRPSSSKPIQHSDSSDCGSVNQDPKEYLFKKMFEKSSKNAKAAADAESELDNESCGDLVSEAGTYILENKHAMVNSQIVLDSDQQSDSSTTLSEIGQHSSSPRTNSNVPNDKSGNDSAKCVRRSLMSDLRRVRDENKRGAVSTSMEIRNQLNSKYSCPQSRFFSNSNQPNAYDSRRSCNCSSQNKRVEVSNAFSRGDGGRFSMRSQNSKNLKTTGSDAKPKNMRAGISNAAPSHAKKNETPEMIAWLRRKEYNPAKRAAADMKKNQLKQREVFVANRSMSFHTDRAANGQNESTFSKWRKMNLANERRSHDDLSRLGEEFEDFGSLSLAESSSSLKKTVDELTQKCRKSIELLRLCNQTKLSSSVENMLESVVEDNAHMSEETEQNHENETQTQKCSSNISDRLERLCSAFDAIQKYLEGQSSNTAPS